MATKTIADLIREKAGNWVETASLETLLNVLPADILAPAAVTAVVKPVCKRRPKRVRRFLTNGDWTRVRAELKALPVDSSEYWERRDALCRELGVTRLQVAGALRWSKCPSLRKPKTYAGRKALKAILS